MPYASHCGSRHSAFLSLQCSCCFSPDTVPSPLPQSFHSWLPQDDWRPSLHPAWVTLAPHTLLHSAYHGVGSAIISAPLKLPHLNEPPGMRELGHRREFSLNTLWNWSVIIINNQLNPLGLPPLCSSTTACFSTSPSSVICLVTGCCLPCAMQCSEDRHLVWLGVHLARQRCRERPCHQVAGRHSLHAAASRSDQDPTPSALGPLPSLSSATHSPTEMQCRAAFASRLKGESG